MTQKIGQEEKRQRGIIKERMNNKKAISKWCGDYIGMLTMAGVHMSIRWATCRIHKRRCEERGSF